jgi:glycosyltransferase involved in cell wall biosynthesis
MRSGVAERRILFDLLAASTGGQLTRTRAFLSRFRIHDPVSRMWLLQEGRALGSLPDVDKVSSISVASPANGKSIYRALWQNTRLPALARELGANVYLSFSHYLPARLPANMLSIIGVANLAPFSEDALRAESTLAGRMRLKLLRRRIVSSSCHADHVIALSRTCRDILISEGVTPGKIHVIPNGVEAVPSAEECGLRLSQLRDKYVLPEKFLLYVSHFYPYKNFERLVQAYALLDPASAAPLVLVGLPQDARYFSHINQEIKRLHLNRRIIVIPGLDAVCLSALYRAATLFVYPSLIENSPNILLEAMAHGSPVLAGNNQPMPEFGGDAIEYFDALSVPSIASAISRCLANPDRLEEMRRHGPLRAREYSWDDFTHRVVALYSRHDKLPMGQT